MPLEDLRGSEKKGVQWSRHINENLNFLFVDTEGENLRTICDRHSAALPIKAFLLGYEQAELILKDVIKPLQVLAVSERGVRGLDLQSNPKKSFISKWMNRYCTTSNSRGEEVPDKYLQLLPSNTPEFPQLRSKFGRDAKTVKDPVNTLKYLKFCKNLTQLKVGEEALEDAIDCVCEKPDLANTVREQNKAKLKTTQLKRARLQLDTTANLINRRRFRQLYESDPDSVCSIHVYSDGSPVAGSELQGMVMDIIFLTNVIKTLILPGVCLHFSGLRVIDKVVAFIHSVTLAFGFHYPLLEWLFSKISSLTTDMGVELGMADCPDILRHYLRRAAGLEFDRIVELGVDSSTRLFSNALRLAGWSHMFGNLMKYACYSNEQWPKIYDHVRHLCSFFRVQDWRLVVVKRLNTTFPESADLLKHFSAKTAKWRYETAHTTFDALLKLSHMCTHFLLDVDAWFPNFQDKDLLLKVREACQWRDLWCFMRVFFDTVLNPLERGRRWGLVCDCCRELRRLQAARVRCPWASRRLKQARKFCLDLVAELYAAGRELTLAACGGIQWVYDSVQHAILKSATMLKTKSSYLSKVLVLVVEADDPVQAANCAQQYRSMDDACMTPLERRHKADLMQALEATHAKNNT